MNIETLAVLCWRIFRCRSSVRAAGVPALADQIWMRLATVTALRDQEIGCDAAYTSLDAYADRVSCGENAAVLMPLVHHHLEMCPDCREELDALLRAVDATNI